MSFVGKAKMSDQFVMCVVFTVQNAIAAVMRGEEEGIDITETLKNFQLFVDGDREIFVTNPPHVKATEHTEKFEDEGEEN